MLSLRIGLARCLAVAATLLAVFVFPAEPARAQVQTSPTASNLPPTRLKVTSNLVVVRVVVRDAQGKPVKGLRKEDFKLFDAGKEQPIAQFEVESAVSHLRLRWRLVSQNKQSQRFLSHCPDGFWLSTLTTSTPTILT
jgi:hypothetical protein